MPNSFPSQHSFKSWWQGLALGALTLIVALPWIRNHDHLRDFMDYGLVMAAVGRMDAGENPYRDFTTPIQAGFLQLNRLAEKIGGGDYLGMTYGGLALIVVSFLAMTWLLSRRLAVPWALFYAATLTTATASQHTIIWHNPLGVICLAFATWSAACAPRWNRSQIGWHLVLGLALWIGGINKISFQLLTLVGATGFIVRDLWIRRDRIRANVGLLGFVLCSGVVLPLITELWLTGVNLAIWHANVIGLAGSSRAVYLGALQEWSAYLRPMHDYYNPLPVPQFGLWFVVSMIGLALILGWKRSLLDRFLLGVAALGCAFAASALLVTNHEIAYISGGACVVLGMALLLAFTDHGRISRAGLAWLGFFAMINGTPAWWSGWEGDRSQFGHSGAAREDYVELAALDPKFGYLQGVLIPPEMADSYRELHHHIPPANRAGLHPVLYATGVEWLERIWPSIKVKGLPLWMHDGTSYQWEQGKLLYELIMPPSRYDVLVASVPWDHWPGQSHVAVALFTDVNNSGSALRTYRTQADLRADNDEINLINQFGTNFETKLLRFYNIVFQSTPDGEIYFGILNGDPGIVYLDWRGSRAKARGVLRRFETSDSRPIKARFDIEYALDGDWHYIESRELELPPGEHLATFELIFDGRQRDVRFRVQMDEESVSFASAGWFAPTLLHSQASPGPPPPLVRKPSAESSPSPERLAAFLQTDWEPDDVLLRGGRVTENGYVVEPGGQIWLKANHPLEALNGIIQVAPEASADDMMPLVRVLWYKGGRVQIAWQDRLNPHSKTHHFHSWSSGPEGWFGILVDPLPGVAPITVLINQVIPLP